MTNHGTFRAVVVFTATLAASYPTLSAQDQSQELTNLKQEVQRLAAQQGEVLKRLDELKTLMKGPNAPPEIKYPPSMSIAGEPFRGEANAPVAIIEYGDFECPFCRRFEHDTYPRLMDIYIKTGKVKYLHRDLPLPFHEHAMPAAEAVRCAGAQGKYWPMYDSLFSDQVPGTESEIDERARKLGVDTGKLDACVTGKQFATPIQHEMDEAQKMNIGGTPTFLIGIVGAHGELVTVKSTVVGAQPFSVFQGAVDGLLAPGTGAEHASGSR